MNNDDDSISVGFKKTIKALLDCSGKNKFLLEFTLE